MTEAKATTRGSLAAKLSAAVADVGGKLKADKTNKQQGYDYISADKILATTGQALAIQGIAIVPQVTGAEVSAVDTGNNKVRWDARVTMIELITDGESEIIVPWVGFGSDYAVPDKAIYKAITSGDKYFRMKLLSIGEGNEDGEHEDDEPAKSARQPQRQPAQPAAAKPAAGNGSAPVYTGNVAVFGVHKYPVQWCRLLVNYKKADQSEIDVILQDLALNQDTPPEEVITALNHYLEGKAEAK